MNDPEALEPPRLARSAAVVATGTALSRVTGLLKLAVIASVLGFDRLSDTYNIANQLPNVVYELLLGGVLTATLMRVFVEHLDRDDEEGISAVWTAAVGLLVVISVAGIVAAPAIVRVFSLRLHGAAAARQQAVATDLLRLFMPQMLFYGITALGTVLLNARRRFALPAYASVANNLVVIGVFLLLPHLFSLHGRAPDLVAARTVHGLLWYLGIGTTAGIAAMAIAVLAGLPRSGVHLQWRLDLRHAAVTRVLRLAGWTFGYVVTNQIAFLLVMWLANAHAAGVSAYLAAYTFFQLPHGLLAVSIMTPLDPELALAAARGEYRVLRERFRHGLRLIALVMLPATAGYLVLARPVVQTLLQRGHLSAHDARLTGDVLAAFAFGLAAFSIYLYALRGFYALGDTRTPFRVNAVENAINIVLALGLEAAMGVRGLGLAWALAYVAAAIVALSALGRRIGAPFDRRTSRVLARATFASVLTAGAAWAAARALGSQPAPLRLLVGTVTGAATYLGALRVLQVDELFALAGGRRRADVSPSGRLEGQKRST